MSRSKEKAHQEFKGFSRISERIFGKIALYRRQFFCRMVLLHNRTLHIGGAFEAPEKVNIGEQKANIGTGKANIEDKFTPRTASHVRKLLAAFGSRIAFGRSDVQSALGLKPTRSSALLREMAERGVIEPVSGRGKGKYRFRQPEG